MKIIKYKLMTEVKNTYLDMDGKETEEVTQIFSDVEIRCTAENFDANYAIAEKETYGEITVEDDGEEEVSEPTQLDIIEAQVAYTAMMTDTLLEE